MNYLFLGLLAKAVPTGKYPGQNAIGSMKSLRDHTQMR
mgnify:FL=1